MTLLGHLDAAAPRAFDFEVLCADWATIVGHSLTITIERSLDGGTTWVPFGSPGPMLTQSVGKDGLPGLRWRVGWDGLEMDVRGAAIVQPAPFAWGLSVT
jgi:hypothetical protein